MKQMTSSDLAEKLGDTGLFVGERLCLDFVNTACRRLGVPMDFLEDPVAVRRWLTSAQKIYGDQAPGEWTAGDDPKSLIRILELRAALWELVNSILEERPPAPTALRMVNAVLRSDPVYPSLEFDATGFRQASKTSSGQDAWMAAIARDAVDLFTSGDLSLLRQCECETCVRVFYDTTKNHKRRWCIQRCGNRVKAANYYRRKHQTAQSKA